MLQFRSEIRNSPTQQTIKIFLSNTALDNEVKNYLENVNEIDFIEIRKSVERNRVDENLTIFRKQGVDINYLHETINSSLLSFFDGK